MEKVINWEKVGYVLIERSLTSNEIQPVIHMFSDEVEIGIWLEEKFELDEDWVDISGIIADKVNIYLSEAKSGKWRIAANKDNSKICFTVYENILDHRNIACDEQFFEEAAMSNTEVTEAHSLWRVEKYIEQVNAE